MDLIIVFFVISFFLIALFKKITSVNAEINLNYLFLLYGVHLLLTVVYVIYASITTSDSFAYYNVSYQSEEWFTFFDTGSPFIRFLAWPFIHVLQLSYYSLMLIFSTLGFMGILFFYLSAKENIVSNSPSNRYTSIEYLFLLPNIHFWSSSLGKGSVMIFGIGLLIFGFSRFYHRIFHIIFGFILIYFIRPHILLCSILGIVVGLLFSKAYINKFVRISLIIISITAIYLLADKVLEYTDIESLNIFDSEKLLHKSKELSKSTSGVDISDYNFFLKIFTFWFRPLFIDAPGIMGLIVSVENIFLVYVFAQVFHTMFLKFKKFNGWYILLIFIFLFSSIALAQVSGNLGIALRQKAQIMPLIYIVYLQSLSIKNYRYGNR